MDFDKLQEELEPLSMNEFDLGLCLWIMTDSLTTDGTLLTNRFINEVNDVLDRWLSKYGDILRARGADLD